MCKSNPVAPLITKEFDGVQAIPLELPRRVPAAAGKIADKHQAIIDLCRSPEFSLENQREAVPNSHT
jgi:hypothetical protein